MLEWPTEPSLSCSFRSHETNFKNGNFRIFCFLNALFKVWNFKQQRCACHFLARYWLYAPKSPHLLSNVSIHATIWSQWAPYCGRLIFSTLRPIHACAPLNVGSLTLGLAEFSVQALSLCLSIYVMALGAQKVKIVAIAFLFLSLRCEMIWETECHLSHSCVCMHSPDVLAMEQHIWPGSKIMRLSS